MADPIITGKTNRSNVTTEEGPRNDYGKLSIHGKPPETAAVEPSAQTIRGSYSAVYDGNKLTKIKFAFNSFPDGAEIFLASQHDPSVYPAPVTAKVHIDSKEGGRVIGSVDLPPHENGNFYLVQVKKDGAPILSGVSYSREK